MIKDDDDDDQKKFSGRCKQPEASQEVHHVEQHEMKHVADIV